MCLCNPRSGFVALGMASWSGRPVVLVAGSTCPAKEGLTMGWTMALSLEEEPLGDLDLCDTSDPDFPLASWSCQSWLHVHGGKAGGGSFPLSQRFPPPICLADRSTAIPSPVRSLPAFSRVEIASISAVSKIATRWAPPLRPLSPEEL